MEVKQRFYSLDVLKIVATIFIVFCHFQQVSNVYYPNHLNFYGGKFNFGYMVELFFVLSGFFMFGYIKKIENGLSFKKFYLKRMQRLLPLVFIGAITYECVLYLYELLYQQTWFDIQPNLWGIIIDALGLQDGWIFNNPCVNNPTWYISVLFLCYTIFFIITYLSQKVSISYKYFYLGMIFLGCGIQDYKINLPLLNGSSCRGFYAFFTGVLLSTYVQNRIIKKKEVLIALFLSFIIILNIIFYFDFVAMGLPYLLTFILYPSLIIILCTTKMKRLFANPIWGRWAQISFNVYIWHMPIYLGLCVIMKLFSITINFLNIYNMYYYCIITEIFGTISFFIIEKPLQKKIEILKIK